MEHKADRQQQISAHLFVSGKVQGVGFRNFCFLNARTLGLKGTVRNLDDGRVALEVGGDRDKIEVLIGRLRQGPPRAEVKDLLVSWETTPLETNEFLIDD